MLVAPGVFASLVDESETNVHPWIKDLTLTRASSTTHLKSQAEAIPNIAFKQSIAGNCWIFLCSMTTTHSDEEERI